MNKSNRLHHLVCHNNKRSFDIYTDNLHRIKGDNMMWGHGLGVHKGAHRGVEGMEGAEWYGG